MSIQDQDRAIILDDGSYHYGLIRTPQEKTFAAPYSLDLPPVDIPALPESLNILEWLRIEDQKQQGACAGVTRTTVKELSIYRSTKQIVQLSKQFAYISAQKVDGLVGRDVGSTIEGNAKAGQNPGTPLEEYAQYTGKYYTNFSKEAYDHAGDFILETWMRLRNYDEVLRWLVWGVGGCAIGIPWNSYCSPNDKGCIEQYKSTNGGGHSLALVDWNRKFVDTIGRPYIKMPNSWGLNWGIKGAANIHPRVIDYWCQNETVIGYSTVKTKDIVPLPFDWIKDSYYV